MIAGVLFIIAACICWGFIFVIPLFLTSFSPFEVSLGRYLFFGAASLILLVINRRYLFQRSYIKAWGYSAWFAFLSTLFSYTAVVFCIRYANSAVAALIFGMAPITIALSGNWYRKEFSFRSFLLPGMLMISGITLANLNAFTIGETSFGLYIFGVVCGLVGLASWTWYTIANHHYLKKNPLIPPNDWVVMMGVATLFLAIIAAAVMALFCQDFSQYMTWTPELKSYLLGSMILGVVSTWGAFFFWNCGSLRLPITLAGQLTIFEMIFGLIFVYMIEQRWPFPLEIAGIAVMLVGVLTAFKRIAVKATSHP